MCIYLYIYIKLGIDLVCHIFAVYNKPLKTIEHELPSPKHRPNIEEQTNVIYKIPCRDCGWSYIKETGRCLKNRKAEHIKNVKYHAKGSNVANHVWDNDHSIDFNNSVVIHRQTFRARRTLESWHTAATKKADNNSKPFPTQYSPKEGSLTMSM